MTALTEDRSYIRQRHSFSRLLITRRLFDTLMVEFHVFPRFKEFVLLFGAKYKENEVSPPQLQVRRLESDKSDAGTLSYAGFGMFPFSPANCRHLPNR